MLTESLTDDQFRFRLQQALASRAPQQTQDPLAPGLALTVVPLSSTSSTMDVARDWRGPASAPNLPRCSSFWPTSPASSRLDGICFLAREQSAGRGREERQWVSARDQGIYSTFLFAPDCQASQLSGYSLVVGLAVQRALRVFGADLIVKWPNDLVASLEGREFRKLGGILVDSTGGSNAGSSIKVSVGIGINIHPQQCAARPGALKPTSLTEIVPTADIFSAFSEVAFHLMAMSRDFFSQGFAGFREIWNRESGFVGREVNFVPHQKREDSGFRGRVVGVDSSGGLVLSSAEGERVCYSGSLELLPPTA